MVNCNCIWCDNAINGPFVNVSGQLMHKNCHRDYCLEIEEVMEGEVGIVNMMSRQYSKEFVDTYSSIYSMK